MRRRPVDNLGTRARRCSAGVVLTAALVAPVLAFSPTASAVDPVPTTPTTVGSTTTTSSPVVPVAPAAKAAPVAAAAPTGVEQSRRATGIRGHFAAKQAAVLPRPVSDRGTTSEPVAVMAIELGRAIENGAAPADVAGRRAKLAALVAGRVKTATATQLDAAWAATSPQRLVVLLTALAQVGKRYQYNTAGPDSFDCSGLVLFAWAEVGVKLPHNDVQQITAVNPRTEATLSVADLAEYPGHIAVYLGVGKAIVHAEQTGVPVRVTDYSAATDRFGSPLP